MSPGVVSAHTVLPDPAGKLPHLVRRAGTSPGPDTETRSSLGRTAGTGLRSCTAMITAESTVSAMTRGAESSRAPPMATPHDGGRPRCLRKTSRRAAHDIAGARHHDHALRFSSSGFRLRARKPIVCDRRLCDAGRTNQECIVDETNGRGRGYVSRGLETPVGWYEANRTSPLSRM
jgi:hypothetical protein